MTRTRVLSLSVWLLLVAMALLVVGRARYSADLSVFLPRAPSASQQLLVQQLQDGLASRLILVGIEGADGATRARVSRALAATLRARAEFVSVSNGEDTSEDQDREFVFRHRYVLSPTVNAERYSVDGLRAAIADNLELVASAAGSAAKSLFVSDPTGETLQVIDQLQGTPPRREAGVWTSADGARALLIAQTRAVGSDTDAQAQAIGLIRTAFASAATATPLQLLLSGPAVFSVEARTTIEHEAVRLSLLSTALIVTLLLLVYRSLPTLLIGLLPVACGALAGVAAVALGFGVVHGITLGFGVTLIGESVDYSIYLFIQTSHGRADGAATSNAAVTSRAAATSNAPNPLWRTIGLGVLTSICGFASLLPSSFPGLAQLGLFSISGLTAAAAVTRFVLPQLPVTLKVSDLAPLGAGAARLLARTRLPWGVAAGLALACAVVLFHDRARLWNRDLSALSPVSADAQALDAAMRADLGAPDIGDLVVVNADSQQAALQGAEAVGGRLDELVEQQVIAGYDSAARFLPSDSTQASRRESLPDPALLRSRLALVAEGLHLKVDALQPFVQQLTVARTAALLTRADLDGTSFALGADALLWQRAGAWHALLPLRAAAPAAGVAAGPQAEPGATDSIDIERVRAAVAGVTPDHVLVMNIKQELDTLYGSYLAEAVHLSLAGLAAIVVLLLVALRSAARAARVVAPLLLAVLVVAAGFALAGTRLTILHLIGMLLIVAVGSNYALFFDRRAADHDATALPLTLASLLLANACTVIGFGVLAFARVPVLSALGGTVAPGTLLALLFAALLAPRRVTAGAHDGRRSMLAAG
jgi:predicted exporter